MSYVDNSASQWSLTKGYSSDTECNTIVGLFWCMAGILGICPWFERVPSKAQLADASSRGVCSFNSDHGWQQVDVDISPFWDALTEAVTSHRDCDIGMAQRLLLMSIDIRKTGGLVSPPFP